MLSLPPSPASLAHASHSVWRRRRDRPHRCQRRQRVCTTSGRTPPPCCYSGGGCHSWGRGWRRRDLVPTEAACHRTPATARATCGCHANTSTSTSTATGTATGIGIGHDGLELCGITIGCRRPRLLHSHSEFASHKRHFAGGLHALAGCVVPRRDVRLDRPQLLVLWDGVNLVRVARLAGDDLPRVHEHARAVTLALTARTALVLVHIRLQSPLSQDVAAPVLGDDPACRSDGPQRRSVRFTGAGRACLAAKHTHLLWPRWL